MYEGMSWRKSPPPFECSGTQSNINWGHCWPTAICWMIGRANRSTSRKPVPESFFAPQIKHDMTRARNRQPRWEAGDYPPDLRHGGWRNLLIWRCFTLFILFAWLSQEGWGRHDITHRNVELALRKLQPSCSSVLVRSLFLVTFLSHLTMPACRR
jgi:hypothetical protein